MARWEPDARGRLEKAAMELFEGQGYTETTVEQIAAHAGLTERTFFRYFVDKREVLFSGSKELEKSIVGHIDAAAVGAGPLDVVVGALAEAGAELQARRDPHFVRTRYALVTQYAEIQERELIKLASLALAVTQALQARGVSEPAASLAAEAGIAVFKVGFERWVNQQDPSNFDAHIRAAAATLRAIATEA
jgi:AcrR family transcriptional regulator